MVSNFFILVSSALLVANFIGIFFYSKIEEDNPNLMEDHFSQISEEIFWENAYMKPGEEVPVYANRLCTLVSKRMLFIDSKYSSPTFFENYILWAYAKVQGGYEWKNTRRSVRLGGGFCSQHAIIFNNILREQDTESRMIELNGHVLNEVLIDSKWKSYDPDFNVIFEESIKSLESDSLVVYQTYLQAGRTEEEARYLMDAFTSSEDNWHFSTAEKYSTFGFLFEKISLYLIWILPLFLILATVFMMKYTFVKFSTLSLTKEADKTLHLQNLHAQT